MPEQTTRVVRCFGGPFCGQWRTLTGDQDGFSRWGLYRWDRVKNRLKWIEKVQR